MPNDVIHLKALCRELDDVLTGGRIEKIYQPERDEITLAVRRGKLVSVSAISADPRFPRVHITEVRKENNPDAPPFCMLLRKYLSGGTIEAVSLLNLDRIIQISVNSRSELRDKASFFLIAEIMGRYSNIILTKEDYTIIDAVKKVSLEQSPTRPILPGLRYEPPGKNKISLDDAEGLGKFFSGNIGSFRELQKSISGIGAETAREIFDAQNPLEKLRELLNIASSEKYSPAVLKENGEARDFFVYPYSAVDGEFMFLPTLNACADEFYKGNDAEERKKGDTKRLRAFLKRLIDRNDRGIEECQAKINAGGDMEKFRLYGELLLCNVYRLRRGIKECVLKDYEQNDVKIHLDEKLTPLQNAQNYFKKYGKAKRGKEFAEKRITELSVKKDYLESIKTALQNSVQKREYAEIFEELQTFDGGGKSAVKRKKTKPATLSREEFKGCEIIFGRNNVQNNEVTFKAACRNDIWMHVRNRHGSHVVIKGEANDEVILRGAEIAAYYSDARDDEKVEVDYTSAKYVKKIPSALPGQVTYTGYKTVFVKPKK